MILRIINVARNVIRLSDSKQRGAGRRALSMCWRKHLRVDVRSGRRNCGLG